MTQPPAGRKSVRLSIVVPLALLVGLSPLVKAGPADAQKGEVIRVSSPEELERIFEKPLSDVTVHLRPGEYHLTPSEAVDSTCGNCEDPNQMVPVTVGLVISGRNVTISGPDDQSAVIHTNAGYGIYVKDCENCVIQNLTITGGVRDADPNATDAAVVVKSSTATLRGNTIVGNIGDSTIVAKNIVGVMGVCGRENSSTTIISNQILRNSWDGIALYRDATAWIFYNVIDGVDNVGGRTVGGGRGVGIGVTWNATARIGSNLVRRYWKGIGLFVDAQGTVWDNIVENMLTWGISLWDAGKGNVVGRIERNVVYNTGACGVSVTNPYPEEPWGRLTENIIVKTGQNPAYDASDYYCYQCALALHDVAPDFVIENNIFYGNRRASADLPDYDVDKETFVESIGPSCERLSRTAILRQSDFLADYGP